MINVGTECVFKFERNADAVKERTPKREILSEKFLIWAHEKHFCDCLEVALTQS